MNLKPWMINDKMWASGMKANNWVETPWLPLGWFTTRNPEKWSNDEIDYFDYCFAIMIQKDSGWI